MRAVDRWCAALVPLAVLCACEAGAERRAASRAAHEVRFSAWSEPVNLGPVVNSDAPDLTPALSRDTMRLYFASDRVAAGAVGGRDIWVSRRACVGCPWEAPVNVTAVNSTALDSDPELSPDGHLLFFLSNRVGLDAFGGDDLYVSHREDTKDDLAWGPPVNLGPLVNTAFGEAGPFFLPSAEDGQPNFYFARGDTPGSVLGFDLYQTTVTRDGEPIGTATLLAELSMPGFGDPKAVVRRDGREVFFWSNRPGGISPGTVGQQFDLWTSTRRSVHEPWSAPVVVAAPLNTVWNELTLDLSHDGRTIVFASNRPGSLQGRNDLWMSTRERLGDEGDDDDGVRDWIRQFGTAAADQARAVAVDGPAVYVSGVTSGALPGQTNPTGQDVFVQRYDRRGNLVWTRQVGTLRTAETFASELTARRGRIYVGGRLEGDLPGTSSDGFLQVFDADGAVVWTHQIGTSLEDYVRNMAVAEDGSVFITGHTQGTLPDVPPEQANPNPGTFDGFVRKLDRHGNTIWTRQFGTTRGDEPIGITLVEDRILVAGATEGALTAEPNAGSVDVFVAELDPEGRIAWIRQFGSAGSESAWQVVADEHAIYVAAGTDGNLESPASNQGLFDAFLAKLSRDGDLEWIRQFGTPVQDRIYDLAIDGDGVLTSGQIGELPDPLDAFLRRYDADGNVTWHLEVAPTELQSAALGLAVAGEDVFVAGGTQGTLPGNTRSWTGQDPYLLRIAGILGEAEDGEDE